MNSEKLQVLFSKNHHLALIKQGNKPQDCDLTDENYTLEESDSEQNFQVSNGTKGRLQLLIDDCDLKDLELLNQLIISLSQSTHDTAAKSINPDYSQYYSAIIGSSLYKPANPQLALMQVAKAYNLDVKALKECFKHYQQAL